MDIIKNTIEDLIPDDLVIIDYNDFSKSGKLKIIIDGINGIDLKTTSSLAKKIKKLNVINETFPDGIQLEISSPGIGADLMFPFQYKKNLGRTLKIITSDNLDNLKIELSSCDDVGLEGILPGGEKINLTYDQIEKAKVIVNF
jgi:ribosome maturation factor RimP|tara:strand:+ start:284 stop:712 length:429 start_codon:yes stop_codon:yes gene_type:complete